MVLSDQRSFQLIPLIVLPASALRTPSATFRMDVLTATVAPGMRWQSPVHKNHVCTHADVLVDTRATATRIKCTALRTSPLKTHAQVPSDSISKLVWISIHIHTLDIDECAGSPSPCPANSVCNNTMGSFTCSCNPGTTPAFGGSVCGRCFCILSNLTEVY